MDVDECERNRGPCRGNVHCTNTVGSFTCACWYGYETVEISDWESLKRVPSCLDINECTNKGSCPKNSECQNTSGGFICQCHAGFEGSLCTDINECALIGSCHADAVCTNTEGNYTCACDKGFYGDGITCKAGQCDDKRCPSDQQCVSPTSNQCSCKNGFTPDKNADFCLDIDECSLDHECHLNSTCANSKGSYNCLCKAGFFGNGYSCQEGHCTDDLCDLNEDCVSPTTLDCRCKDGFERDETGICVDIDECLTNGDICDVNADCSNTDGSFECECHEGFFGSGLYCFIGSCTASNCQANEKCASPTSIDCECAEGFVYNNQSVCVDIDECASGTHK